MLLKLAVKSERQKYGTRGNCPNVATWYGKEVLIGLEMFQCESRLFSQRAAKHSRYTDKKRKSAKCASVSGVLQLLGSLRCDSNYPEAHRSITEYFLVGIIHRVELPSWCCKDLRVHRKHYTPPRLRDTEKEKAI